MAKYAIVTLSMPTTNGATLDFAKSGMGDVDAVLLLGSPDTNPADVAGANPLKFPIGAISRNGAGADVCSAAIHADHNGSSADVYRYQDVTDALTIIGDNNTFDARATFTSWITDGVRVTFSTAPSFAGSITAIMFSDLDGVACGSVDNTGGDVDTQYGFDEDLILFFGNRRLHTSTIGSHGASSLGVWHRGSGFQASINHGSRDGVGTAETYGICDETVAVRNTGFTSTSGAIQVSAISNGFRAGQESGGSRSCFLALKMPAGESVWAGSVATPATAGDLTIPNGFNAGLLLGMLSGFTDNVFKSGTDSNGVVGRQTFAAYDGTEEISYQFHDENDADPTNTGARVRDVFFDTTDDTGASERSGSTPVFGATETTIAVAGTGPATKNIFIAFQGGVEPVTTDKADVTVESLPAVAPVVTEKPSVEVEALPGTASAVTERAEASVSVMPAVAAVVCALATVTISALPSSIAAAATRAETTVEALPAVAGSVTSPAAISIEALPAVAPVVCALAEVTVEALPGSTGDPPADLGEVRVRDVRQAAITSGSTQDFTFAGFGTPKAARIVCSRASAENTETDGSALAVGFYDGTTVRSISNVDRHGVPDSDTSSTSSALQFLRILAPDGTLEAAATVAMVADGIRLTWVTLPPVGYQIDVRLYGGDSLDAEVVQFTAPGDQPLTQQVPVTFTPDAIMVIGNDGLFDEAIVPHAQWVMGYAVNGSGGIVQGSVQTSSADAENKARGGAWISSQYVAKDMFATSGIVIERVAVEVTSFDSGGTAGFTVTAREFDSSDPPANERVYAALCFGFKGTAEAALEWVPSPGSAGADPQATLGIEPQAVDVLLTRMDVNDSGSALAQGSVYGIGHSDGQSQGCMVVGTFDDATVMDTYSVASDEAIYVPTDAGGTTDLCAASMTSLDAAGYTPNYSAVPTVPVHLLVFGISTAGEPVLSSGLAEVNVEALPAVAPVVCALAEVTVEALPAATSDVPVASLANVTVEALPAVAPVVCARAEVTVEAFPGATGAPPADLGAVRVRDVRQAAITSGSTQDFTFSGFGTPKAARIVCTRASVLNTETDGSALAIGFYDGTNVRSISNVDRHGLPDSDTSSTSSSLQFLRILAPDGTLEAAATVAMVTDGIRLTWVTLPPVGYQIDVRLYGGDNLQAELVEFTAPGDQPQVQQVPVTFTPDAIMLIGNDGLFDEAIVPHAQWVMGYAVNGDGGIVQGSAQTSSADAENKARAGCWISDQYVAKDMFATSGSVVERIAVEVTSFDTGGPTGFTVTAREFDSSDPAANERVYAALCFELGELAEASLEWVPSPAATGADPQATLGFQPQAIDVLLTRMELNNSGSALAQGGVYGIGHADVESQGCMVVGTSDDATVTDTFSVVSDEAIYVPTDAGGASDLCAASMASLDAAGYTPNYSAVPAVPVQLLVFGISIAGEPPITASLAEVNVEALPAVAPVVCARAEVVVSALPASNGDPIPVVCALAEVTVEALPASTPAPPSGPTVVPGSDDPDLSNTSSFPRTQRGTGPWVTKNAIGHAVNARRYLTKGAGLTLDVGVLVAHGGGDSATATSIGEYLGIAGVDIGCRESDMSAWTEATFRYSNQWRTWGWFVEANTDDYTDATSRIYRFDVRVRCMNGTDTFFSVEQVIDSQGYFDAFNGSYATMYCDLDSGNDSNDGFTQATPKRTPKSCFLAAQSALGRIDAVEVLCWGSNGAMVTADGTAGRSLLNIDETFGIVRSLDPQSRARITQVNLEGSDVNSKAKGLRAEMALFLDLDFDAFHPGTGDDGTGSSPDFDPTDQFGLAIYWQNCRYFGTGRNNGGPVISYNRQTYLALLWSEFYDINQTVSGCDLAIKCHEEDCGNDLLGRRFRNDGVAIDCRAINTWNTNFDGTGYQHADWFQWSATINNILLWRLFSEARAWPGSASGFTLLRFSEGNGNLYNMGVIGCGFRPGPDGSSNKSAMEPADQDNFVMLDCEWVEQQLDLGPGDGVFNGITKIEGNVFESGLSTNAATTHIRNNHYGSGATPGTDYTSGDDRIALFVDSNNGDYRPSTGSVISGSVRQALLDAGTISNPSGNTRIYKAIPEDLNDLPFSSPPSIGPFAIESTASGLAEVTVEALPAVAPVVCARAEVVVEALPATTDSGPVPTAGLAEVSVEGLPAVAGAVTNSAAVTIEALPAVAPVVCALAEVVVEALPASTGEQIPTTDVAAVTVEALAATTAAVASSAAATVEVLPAVAPVVCALAEVTVEALPASVPLVGLPQVQVEALPAVAAVVCARAEVLVEVLTPVATETAADNVFEDMACRASAFFVQGGSAEIVNYLPGGDRSLIKSIRVEVDREQLDSIQIDGGLSMAQGVVLHVAKNDVAEVERGDLFEVRFRHGDPIEVGRVAKVVTGDLGMWTVLVHR